MPEESSQNPDSYSVVDLVLIGSLLMSLLCGILAALAAAVLGGLAAREASSMGEYVPTLRGAVAAAFAAVCLSLAMVSSLKPWYRTAAWFFTSLLCTLALDWFIPSRFAWPVYRWALCGTPFGILIGGYYEPLRLVRGGKIEATGKGKYLVAIAEILAGILKLFSDSQVGSVVAGMVGGAIGGAWSAGVVTAFGSKDLEQWLGSYLVIPISGAVLGTLGGGFGGWMAWRISTAKVRLGAIEDPNSVRKN